MSQNSSNEKDLETFGYQVCVAYFRGIQEEREAQLRRLIKERVAKRRAGIILTAFAVIAVPILVAIFRRK